MLFRSAQTTEPSINTTETANSDPPSVVPCAKTVMQFTHKRRSHWKNERADNRFNQCISCKIYANQTIESLELDVNSSFVSYNYP